MTWNYHVSSERIVVGYTDGQAGKQINDKDDVRSENLVYSRDEINRFWQKSRACCPTYGCCAWCWNAGPVGNVCPLCLDEGHIRSTFGVVYFHPDLSRQQRCIIDAERLCEKFGTCLLVPAMADAMAQWITIPIVVLTEQDIHIMLKQKGLVDYQRVTKHFHDSLKDVDLFNW